jgi:hypothetical protein
VSAQDPTQQVIQLREPDPVRDSILRAVNMLDRAADDLDRLEQALERKHMSETATFDADLRGA